uniref:Uncharacterized protein n=1 Tax=Panagrolaimus superbus TaxID=310955 RepID=A0A914YY05_9BILA
MFPDENFDLSTSINANLVDVIPHVEFSEMSCDFLTNFVLEKGFLLSPADVTQHFLSKLESLTYVDASDPESSFKETVKLAEKLALKKQEKFPEDNFNIGNSVKAYLVDVIPKVDFSKMDNSILTDFIGLFLFTSVFL